MEKAWTKREVVDTSNVFITTTIENSNLIAPKVVSTPLELAFLARAIELFAKENLVAKAKCYKT